MHRSCAARYFRRLSNSIHTNTNNNKSTYPCPTCKQEWNKNDVVNMLRETNTNDETDDRQSVGIIKKKQRTSKTNDYNNS